MSGLPALDNTMGAMYLGVMLSMALWGAGTVQLYYYYNLYPNDNVAMKAFVAAVWVLDTVHQGLITHSLYIYLVTNFFNPAFLQVLERTLLDMVMFTAMICLLVQSFFGMRIWKLSRNYFMTGFVMVFVVAQFLATCVYFGKAIHFKSFAQLLTIKEITRSINIVNAVADASIAAVLVFLLQKSRTGFRTSETIINRLIIFTVNTGLLTGCTAIVCLIMNIVFPDTFLYILFYLMTSRLYVNSLYATLNSRKSILSGSMETSEGMNSISLGRIRSKPFGWSGASREKLEQRSAPRVVEINMETDIANDASKSMSVLPSELDVESTLALDKGVPI